MSGPVVSLDVGHSAVKCAVSYNGEVTRFLIPSVVCAAVPISDEAEAKRAEQETIVVAPGPGGSFFFGETAITQGGGNISGLSDNWIASREHTALIMGAMKKVKQLTGYSGSPDLVMGLPARLVATQREELEAMVMEAIRDVGDLKIVSQASAPLYGILLDGNGFPSRDHDASESWGVVEVGYYTTDFMMTKKGRWTVGGSDGCSGVRVAAEHVKRVMAENQIQMTLGEAEEVLQTRKVKVFGKMIDASQAVDEAVGLIATEVIDTANRLMESYARQLDGVLVAGGGAPMVFDQIKEQWPHAILVDDHRFAVAEGMRRLGVARRLKRETEATKLSVAA